MSTYVVERLAKIEATMVPEDMDPMEKDVLEEAMLHPIIKASLKDQEDDIVETNCVYHMLVIANDEKMVEAIQSEEMDADKLIRMKKAYGMLEYVLDYMIVSLEQKKILHLTTEPMIFAYLSLVSTNV